MMTDRVAEAAAATRGSDERVVRFRDGIPGFPEHQRFQLVDLVDGGAFQLLQSVDDPDMAMIVSVPWLFFPDYSPELTETDQTELGLESSDDAIVFCPVTLDVDEETASMNLLGPFVVNARTLEGRQVVLAGDQPTRAPIPLA